MQKKHLIMPALLIMVLSLVVFPIPVMAGETGNTINEPIKIESPEAPDSESPDKEEPIKEEPSKETPVDKPEEVDKPAEPNNPEETDKSTEDKSNIDVLDENTENSGLGEVSDIVWIAIALIAGAVIIVIALIVAKVVVAKSNAKANNSDSSVIPANSVANMDASNMGTTIMPGNGRSVPLEISMRMGKANTSNVVLTGRLTIGSDISCNIIINDASVEPVHAYIELRNEGIYLVDNSNSGTYLEGMRISIQNKLDSGDIVSLGNTEFAIKF